MSKVGEYYRELEEMGHEPNNNEGEPMEYQTHNDVIIETSGTSLVGEIKLDYYDILNRLGNPVKFGGGNKVSAEWEIEFYDGTVATLYNWKNGRNYCGEDGLELHQIDEWHVGGFNGKALDKVNELFKGEENG